MSIFNQNLRTYQVDSRGDATYGFDNHFRFQVYRCFWPDCIKPTTTSTTTTTTTTVEGIFGILFLKNIRILSLKDLQGLQRKRLQRLRNQ